jgi:hypothetical protein
MLQRNVLRPLLNVTSYLHALSTSSSIEAMSLKNIEMKIYMSSGIFVNSHQKWNCSPPYPTFYFGVADVKQIVTSVPY